MHKQRLEELLASYRQLNHAEQEELEQGIAEHPEYATRLANFRQLDHALQQAGAQRLRQVQSAQTRLHAIGARVMFQEGQSSVGRLATLHTLMAGAARPLQGFAVAGALLLLLLLTYGLMGRSDWLDSLSSDVTGPSINGSSVNGSAIILAPNGAANAPLQQQVTSTSAISIPSGAVSATIANRTSISSLTTPGFAFGIEAQLLNGAAAMALTATQQLGFTWVRQKVAWADFQPAADSATQTPSALDAIDWTALRSIVQAAEAHEIKLLVTIHNAPDWAREPGFDNQVGGPAADPQTYAAFVGALAGEFCGSALQALEVWHGENLGYTWGNLSPDPAAYMQLLQAAYPAIKSACPAMRVISGATIPAGTNLPYAMDDLEYLEALYDLGLANYADGIGAHHDGYNVPATVRWQAACAAIQQTGQQFNGPCESPHHSWSLRSTLESYREIMLRHEDGAKPIWPTSFGWPAGEAISPSYSYVADNDRQEQATWSVEAYQMMQAAGWVGPAFLNNLNVRALAGDTPEAQWSILQGDYTGLPAYMALQALATMPKASEEPPASEELEAVGLAAPCADPRATIHSPSANALLSGLATITGTATHEAFHFYKLEYAPGANQVGGFAHFGSGQVQIVDGALGVFDTTLLPNGKYTIRLIVVDQAGTFVPPCDVTVSVQN